MTDLALLQTLLRTHIGGRDLTVESTWAFLADRRCHGQRQGTTFQCTRTGVELTQNGYARFMPYVALAQPALIDEQETLS